MIFLGNTANSRRQKTLRTILSIHHHAHTVVQALLLLFAEYTARRITPVAHDLKDSSSRLQHLKPRCIHAWTLTITCDSTRGAHGVTVRYDTMWCRSTFMRRYNLQVDVDTAVESCRFVINRRRIEAES